MNIHVRVMLTHSRLYDYAPVHAAMAKIGFVRTWVGSDGVTRELPHAEYRGSRFADTFCAELAITVALRFVVRRDLHLELEEVSESRGFNLRPATPGEIRERAKSLLLGSESSRFARRPTLTEQVADVSLGIPLGERILAQLPRSAPITNRTMSVGADLWE
jgi:hypothetical protein